MTYKMSYLTFFVIILKDIMSFLPLYSGLNGHNVELIREIPIIRTVCPLSERSGLCNKKRNY